MKFHLQDMRQGASVPCASNALLIEMLTDRRIVKRIAALNYGDESFFQIFA